MRAFQRLIYLAVAVPLVVFRPGGQAFLVLNPLHPPAASSGRHAGYVGRVAATRQSENDNDDYWYYAPNGNDDNNERIRRRPFVRTVRKHNAIDEPSSRRDLPIPDDTIYYDDDETTTTARDIHVRRPPQRREPPVVRDDIDDYDEEEEDDLYDEDDNDEEDDSMEPLTGNFWSNPSGSSDRPLQQQQRRRRPPGSRRPRRPLINNDDNKNGRRQKKSTRTTFRSGVPQVPAPILDAYNRIFWYGIDADDDDTSSTSSTTSAADKTMFGGTKGKFNGLAYVNGSGGMVPPPEAKTRRKRRDREDGNNQEYYVEPKPPPRPVTPPYDRPDPGPGSGRTSRRRRPARSETTKPDDWMSQRVSSWFSEKEDDDDEFDPESRDPDDDNVEWDSYSRRSKRRNKKSDNEWLPGFGGVLDAFLGLNRQELQVRAREYDQRMGIGPPSPPNHRPRDRPRRNGYPYTTTTQKEDVDDTIPKEEDTVIDTEFVAEPNVQSPARDESTTTTTASTAPPQTMLSWEERALAIERVPPPDVPAWGVSGELGMDARTKAITDALEDVAGAREMVRWREKKEATLREDLTVLRVDAELEKKRLLRQSEMDILLVQERIRRLDRRIDNAARSLRYAQMQSQTARDYLAEILARHWAVLSFYDPERAEKAVDEAIRELEENEPAVRRFVKKSSALSNDALQVDEPVNTNSNDAM